jgi:cell division protein FtsW
MKKRLKSSKTTRKPDLITLTLTLVLVSIGLIMVLDASIIEAYTQFQDKYHFVKLQSQWLLAGLFVMGLVAITPLSFIKKVAPLAMIGALVLLVAVLIPGVSQQIQGSRRWIVIGSFVFQPSELAKLASVIYFPYWLQRHQRFTPFIALTGLITGLLLLEPDLGTAIIIFACVFSMYYVSGAPSKHLFYTLAAGVVGALIMIVSSPYRFIRLKTFLNPAVDPLGSSYHIRQILISLGSGGLLGTGFGRSRQKFQFLPEATTDSIFAVIAEETGFLGAVAVILIFMTLFLRLFKIVPRIDDAYARLVLVGVIAWLGTQTAVNLAAMVALVPLTGVPLPFISYGGSSLITALTAVGLALNVSRYRGVKL